MASEAFGMLYIGVTSDLIRRVWEHREKCVAGFTQKYDLTILVYYEMHATTEAAITREKQMKKWNRNWKLRQIMGFNPEWRDLYGDITH